MSWSPNKNSFLGCVDDSSAEAEDFSHPKRQRISRNRVRGPRFVFVVEQIISRIC